MKIEITSFERTCGMSPEQWEGKLKNGRTFYARLDDDMFTLEVSPEPSDDVDDVVFGINLIETYLEETKILGNKGMLKIVEEYNESL